MNKSKNIKHTHCKTCQRKASNAHYENNKKIYIDRAVTWNRENKTRASIAHNHYALKRYERCTCCTKKEIDEFINGRPDGYQVDHLKCKAEGGLHCLKNLQYLTISEHASKSNKERRFYEVNRD